VAWNLRIVIYKSGWNKIAANKDNLSFRRYISMQFNKKKTTNISRKEAKGKQYSKTIFQQASILKVPLPIPPRPSKDILVKSKFFKGSNMSKFNNQSKIFYE